MKTQTTQTTSNSRQILVAFPENNNETWSASIRTEFDLRRYPAKCMELLRNLRNRVANRLEAEYAELLDSNIVQQAVNEADAIAAATAFPSLFLPVLAEEKVQAASTWNARQRRIRTRTLALAA